MATDLIVLEKYDIEAVFSDGGVDPIIKKLEEEADSFVPDLSTDKSRKEIVSFSMKFSASKKILDDAGKKLAAGYLAKIEPINTERKKIRECCDALKAKVRSSYEGWKATEEKRVEDIKKRISNFEALAVISDFDGLFDSVYLKDNLIEIKNIAITEKSFAGFASEAAVEKDMAVKKLERAIEDAEKREEEAVELDRLRKEAEDRKAKEAAEKAKRDQEEREERIRKEEAEKVIKEAKRKAKAEAERVENERVEAKRKAQEDIDNAKREKEEAEAEIARQKQAVIDAEAQARRNAEEAKHVADKLVKEAAQRERDRIEEERKAEEAATKKRETDRAHKSKINNAAKFALEMLDVEKKQAKAIITAIAKGKIPHVSIKY